jgi:hypothetical protein
MIRDRDFSFEEDIIPEIKLNERMRKQLFEEKFPAEISKQKALRLNSITDSLTKS